MSLPNFSFLACLEVAQKFVVGGWCGVGWQWLLCLTQVKLNWSLGWVFDNFGFPSLNVALSVVFGLGGGGGYILSVSEACI